jgi:hypothetical protein
MEVSIDQHYGILDLLLREPVMRNNDTSLGLWKTIGRLKLRLAIMQKDRLSKWHAKLDIGYQPPQINIKILRLQAEWMTKADQNSWLMNMHSLCQNRSKRSKVSLT